VGSFFNKFFTSFVFFLIPPFFLFALYLTHFRLFWSVFCIPFLNLPAVFRPEPSQSSFFMVSFSPFLILFQRGYFFFFPKETQWVPKTVYPGGGNPNTPFREKFFHSKIFISLFLPSHHSSPTQPGDGFAPHSAVWCRNFLASSFISQPQS